jgi:hypothetical protein
MRINKGQELVIGGYGSLEKLEGLRPSGKRTMVSSTPSRNAKC